MYTPDQIFRSGLQNMEPGACYSLNPDRGTIYGWNISYNAQDPWWWREVDCETGDTPLEEGVGSCEAYPGSKPADVFGCYSYNGSCYVCDNSRNYVDCNAGWLWNYNFPGHDWFKKVDCYDPYEEEEDDEICYEIDLSESETYLLKQMSEYVFYNDAILSDNDALELNSDARYYDALGRNLKYGISFDIEKPFYKKVQKSKKNSATSPVLLRSKELKGYVKGTPRMRVCYKKEKEEGGIKTFNVEGSLKIQVGPLVYQGNDERLIAHEKKHKDIWADPQYTGNWNEKFTVTEQKTKKQICESAVEKIWWSDINSVLNNLYKTQNDWDNTDTNNECKERIDITSELDKNYRNLLKNTCLCEKGQCI